MKLLSTAFTSFGALLCAGILVAATAQNQAAQQSKDALFLCAEKAEYKEVIAGVSRAVIAGDPEKGPYRAFTKFVPGTSHALHTHPNEIWIVGLKGAYIHKPEKGDEQRVGPGCYLRIPAGERHASASDAKEGALFFEESSGKFGLDFIKEEKK